MPHYSRTQEIEHEIGPNGHFALRVGSGDVELRAVEGSTVRVRSSYDVRAGSDGEADALLERVQMRAQRYSGRIELDEPARGASSGLGALARLLGGDSYELHVAAEIPRHAEIRVDGVSADITVNGFRGRQAYRTVSGDAVLSELGGEVRLQSVSGDASLRAVESIDVDAGSVSGDLAVMAPRFELLRANTVSGDIEIEGELSPDRDHRVETVSGDLTVGLVGELTLEVRGLSTDVSIGVNHRSEGSRDRRRYVIGAGRPRLDFRSMSGDVSVRPARRIVPAAQPPAAAMAAQPAAPTVDADAQLEILRLVERGEIDIDEAARRLAGGPGGVAGE